MGLLGCLPPHLPPPPPFPHGGVHFRFQAFIVLVFKHAQTAHLWDVFGIDYLTDPLFFNFLNARLSIFYRVTEWQDRDLLLSYVCNS